ncbi:putative protein TPRXL [Hippocampus zosterae]|uniref:putative protein TPRXL n=1 Tax=Hippocampus zosterae TaxID=109293 RepID=UPI00223D397D|nr:putative protein TPRXL [Hippocampus zosterae]
MPSKLAQSGGMETENDEGVKRGSWSTTCGTDVSTTQDLDCPHTSRLLIQEVLNTASKPSQVQPSSNTHISSSSSSSSSSSPSLSPSSSSSSSTSSTTSSSSSDNWTCEVADGQDKVILRRVPVVSRDGIYAAGKNPVWKPRFRYTRNARKEKNKQYKQKGAARYSEYTLPQ